MVIKDLGRKRLSILKNDYNCVSVFHHRYIDDTILSIEENEMDTVRKIFNSRKHLSFTHEGEFGGKINFIAIALIRSDDKILTNWY